MCYEWWASTTNLDPASCYISVSNNSGATNVKITTACPGTTANPGMTCTDVTANASWSCSNFFGPSGNRSQIRSELRKNTGAGGTQSAMWDVLFFNVTYLAPTPVSTCAVISSPGPYKLASSLAGAPNQGSPTNITACVQINASNVVLDCNGFSITNNGTPNSAGILIENENNVTVKNCPGISQYTAGVYTYGMNNSLITNVTSFNLSSIALSMVVGRNNTVMGNTFWNSSDGVDLSASTNNTLVRNNVYNITNTGIFLGSASSANLVTANNVSNSSIGMEIRAANDITSNNLNNDQAGIMLDSGASGSRISANNATSSSYGFFLSNASGNNLTNNLATGSATGFYLSLATGNLLSGNNATGSSNEGFFLITASNGNTLTNDMAVNGVNRGFRFEDNSDNNILANVTAMNNNDTNFDLTDSNGNNISSFISSNAPIGVSLQDSNNTLLSGGLIANSTSYGILIAGSNGTVITGGRTYNNNPDFLIGNILTVPTALSLSNVFDSPAGTTSNYTNISVSDSVENGTGYSMNWSSAAPTLPLPASYLSFGQKFLNITDLTGGVSIDSATWRWLDSEAGAGNETKFQLWKFGSSGWVMLNNSPDTAANALSLSNQGNFSVFAIIFALDTTPPNVTLLAPANGSSVNSPAVQFNFTSGDDMSATMNCSLFIDGALNQTNPSVANNTPTTFTATGVQMGNHTWNVTCKDNASNVGASATWNFFEYGVSACPVITVPGSYVQAVNLLGAPNAVSPPPQSGFSSVCVKIASSNTVYDCNGFNITNNGANNAIGIYLNGSLDNVTVRNCGVSLYKLGALIFQSTDVLFFNNSIHNSTQNGISADTSNNLTLGGNNVSFNKQNGIAVSGGGNNTVVNNTLSNNSQSGMDLLSSPNNNFTGNTADGNALDGLHVASSDFNLFSGNTLLDNKQDGIQVVSNINNTFIDNIANNNSQHGLHIVGTTTNLFINNTMDFNAQDGMLSASSTGSSFIDNTACYNGQSGFLFADSTVDVMTGNTACSNAQNGIFIDNSNLTTLSGNHYFNNTLDFTMLSGTLKILNTTNEIFDNPSDSFQNYTNLSVNDSEVNSTFSISWSPPPASLPTACPVFANKFVNITNTSGNVSIDSITWNYLANETTGLDPGIFRLAVYNGTGWTFVVGQDPQPSSDSISVSDLHQFGVIGIFMCNDSVSALKLDQTALQPSPGGIVQFNITVNNTGNTTLNPLRVVDTLPAGLTFLAASPVPNTVAGQILIWNNVTALAPNSSAVLYVNATVDAGIVSSSVPNATLTNNVTAIGTDPIFLNVTANSSANATVFYANVSIVKVDITPLLSSPGGIVQWQINVTNPGQVALDPALVTDVLPLGFQFLSSSPPPSMVSLDLRTVIWSNVGPIAPGGSAIILLNSSVNANTANGTYMNSVNVTGVPPNGDNVSASDTAQVGIFAPAINIIKTVNQTNASINKNVTYTLNVSNTGSINETVTVVDFLPPNMTFMGSDVPPTTNSSNIVSWVNTTNLPPGGSFVIHYVVQVGKNGTFINNATATGTPPNGNNVTDNATAFLLVNPNPSTPPGDGGNNVMSLSYSFVCPGDKVVFNATRSGNIPLPGVAVNVIYDNPPGYYSAGTVTTGSDGLATITLSANGTYDVVGSETGYNTVHTGFSYVTCPPVSECTVDAECPSDKQCSAGSCQPIQCGCGQSAQNHTCVGSVWQCGSGPSCSGCPSGQSCGADHTCLPLFQCMNDTDCKDTQYCDIPAGAKGGDCKDIQACGLIANHTVAIPYQCGDSAACPACPQNQACVDHICVSYNLTGPEHSFVGENATLNATKGNGPCSFCTIEIRLPDGRVITGTTGQDGTFVLPLTVEGIHNASLIEGGVQSRIQVAVSNRTVPPQPGQRTWLDDYWWLLILLALLILALVYYLWKDRITIYHEPGAIGPNTIAASQGLLDSSKLGIGDTAALKLGDYKFNAKIVPMPNALSLGESLAKGEGNFILAGEAVMKALHITPSGQRDTGGKGFESFARVRGLKMKRAK